MTTPFAAPTQPTSASLWIRVYVTLSFLLLFTGWIFGRAGSAWMSTLMVVAGAVVLAVARPHIHQRRVPKLLPFALLLITVTAFLPPASFGSAVAAALPWWAGTVLATVAGTLLSFDELLISLTLATRLAILAGLIAQLVALVSGSSNSSPLQSFSFGNFAVLAFVVAAVHLTTRTSRRVWPASWLTLAALAFLLNWSPLSLISIVSVVIVLGFAAWMRSRAPGKRGPVYLLAALVAVLTVVPALVFLLLLAYWGEPPTVWDWLTFAALALLAGATLWRSWFLAIDRPQLSATKQLPFTTYSLFPLLLLVGTLSQTFFSDSATCFAVLATFAVVTKRLPHTNELLSA